MTNKPAQKADLHLAHVVIDSLADRDALLRHHLLVAHCDLHQGLLFSLAGAHRPRLLPWLGHKPFDTLPYNFHHTSPLRLTDINTMQALTAMHDCMHADNAPNPAD